jgi:hypothetical protein
MKVLIKSTIRLDYITLDREPLFFFYEFLNLKDKIIVDKNKDIFVFIVNYDVIIRLGKCRFTNSTASTGTKCHVLSVAQC